MRVSATPVANIDAFERDLAALRAELVDDLNANDFAHLQRIERWGRWCTLLGYSTAWLGPNLASALLLAQGNTARWTIVMHHVGHGGYNRVDDVPSRYTSAEFAHGWRRYLDWLDWIHPDAWRYEHNVLHHPRTSECEDPDLVEQNLEWLRHSQLPMIGKLAVVAFFASTWKLTYYAPSTFQAWQLGLWKKNGKRDEKPPTRHASAFNPFTRHGRKFLRMCVAPYATARFVLAPALFAGLGPLAATNVFLNSLAAEILTNLQTFILITSNHASADLPRFDSHASSRAEFYRRQIVGTSNYTTGSDAIDFVHGWLNYHIEHHLFVDLPLSKYRELQPRLIELCEKHGLHYRQEHVLRRARATLDIMLGRASMRKETPADAHCAR